MVLRNALLLAIAGSLGLSVCSCLPKQGGVQAPTAMTVAVAVVVDYPDRPEVSGVPTELAEAVRIQLQGRNLDPTLLPAEAFTGVFDRKRSTLHRSTWLADQHPTSDLVLLVQTEPRYFSLLSGRYRWTVATRLSLSPPGRPEETVETEVSFPIFMEFHHETEEEVLVASAPVIERHLGHLLDEYLGGL